VTDEASDFYRITSVDVARLFGAGSDAIVLEVSIEGGDDTILLWMRDAEAFTFIRRMTEVLFDVDPLRMDLHTTTTGGTA
jgi:hypothetical protein